MNTNESALYKTCLQVYHEWHAMRYHDHSDELNRYYNDVIDSLDMVINRLDANYITIEFRVKKEDVEDGAC